MTKDEKFLYEKAIEGRQHHQENFNHWMSMYSIFNGALFVGYYSIVDKNTLFAFLILIVGCTAGWSWFFSAKGFYDWILSWIKVVKKREEKLESDGKKYVVFRAYIGKKTISTQKITKFFSCIVALAWTVLTATSFAKLVIEKMHLPQCKMCYLSVIVFALILLCALMLYVWTLESDFKIEEIE